MATINEEKLEEIKKYYKSGLSANDISKEIGVSIDAVYYFFRKYKIPRRTPGEVNELIFENKSPSFRLKESLSLEEEKLKIAGIMLYWGEGSKWEGEKIVDFANSDEYMIKVFLNFLRKVCGIDENKLRVYLYCYANQNPEKLKEFWSKKIKIPLKKFIKPYVRKDFKYSKSNKMKNGLIHIRYNDKKLLMLIRNWMEELSKSYS